MTKNNLLHTEKFYDKIHKITGFHFVYNTCKSDTYIYNVLVIFYYKKLILA